MLKKIIYGFIVMLVTTIPLLNCPAMEIKLTVDERLGVARKNEFVTSGVPLPRGAVANTEKLRLFDDEGQPVPAQFGVATRWWEDRSIKWLHVDFQASLSANEKRSYVLRDNASAGVKSASAPATLSVSKTAKGYEVNTGAIRFRVKGKGFNGFDGVWRGKSQLIAPGKGNIIVETPEGKFSPQSCPDTEIGIEEQGPMKAVLLVKGRNTAADGSGYAMDYKCRFYAYAGSPLVRVVYTVENRRGKADDLIRVSDWRVVIPAAVGEKSRCQFGLDQTTPEAFSKVGPGVEVLETHRYAFHEMGKEIAGDPHEEEPPWLGTIDVSGSTGGVTVGVKDFWQMWPKNLTVDPFGNITVGLWTDRVRYKGDTTLVDKDGCAEIFAGIARTHELLFHFHDGKASDPIKALASIREPLFARCEPHWYCQGTKVFGDLSEADPDVYDARWRKRVEALNAYARGSVKKPLERWRTTSYDKVDSYGMLSWGDGVEWIKNKGERPEDVHWEGGYYDYMHSILLNFARTGDLSYLWTANRMISHNADVHHCHHDKFRGNSRYCPSLEHIRADRSSRPPNVSPTFNHWKNLSAFERWYLLGDHRALEAALEISQHAMKLGNHGISFGQPRSICHGILGLWAVYEATGEEKYKEALAAFVKATTKKITEGKKMRSGAWQRGMAIQGLCVYVERTGDESPVPAIVKALDRDKNHGDPELAYGRVFMWKRTGDEAYFYKAVKNLGGKPSKWMQRFGNHGRSKLYVPTIVRKAAQRKPLPPRK